MWLARESRCLLSEYPRVVIGFNVLGQGLESELLVLSFSSNEQHDKFLCISSYFQSWHCRPFPWVILKVQVLGHFELLHVAWLFIQEVWRRRRNERYISTTTQYRSHVVSCTNSCTPRRTTQIMFSSHVFFFSKRSFTFSYKSSNSFLSYSSSPSNPCSSSIPSLSLFPFSTSALIKLISSSLILSLFVRSMISKVRFKSFFGEGSRMNWFIWANSSKERDP